MTGLADFVGVRELFLFAALLVLVPGILALFLPGLGQPAAQWKHVIQLLRTAPTAPAARALRPATLADIDALILRYSPLSALSPADCQMLAKNARVLEAPAGSTVVKQGDKSNAAFFILEGKTVAGIKEGENTRWLETMGAGDFFGEIAALAGVPRTANVVAQEATTLLEVPAQSLRHLMAYPVISQNIRTKYYERLARTNLSELPRFAGFDQVLLKELRTEEAPAI